MSSPYHQSKENLIRSSLIVFATRSSYKQVDLDSIIRRTLSKDTKLDPSCAVDHIRLGMVDLGLIFRSEDGSVYSLNENSLLSAENIKAMFGEHYPVERITNIQQLRKKMKSSLTSKFN